MELLAQIDPPELDGEEEDQARTFAYQVFLQTPDNLNVVRIAYEHYHRLMNEWISTGKRPDHERLKQEWAPKVSAEILPFKQVG